VTEVLPPNSSDQLRERLARLSPEKRALLERRLLSERTGPPKITPRESDEPAQLSYMQELLWLVQQVTPGSSAYNSPWYRRIKGQLDVEVFVRALDELWARHEILRTTYHIVDGEPRQVVNAFDGAPLAQVDLTELPPAEREEELERLVAAELTRPFDLTHDHIVRPTLFRLGPEEHVVGMVGHHIALDGWSKGLIYRELSALYAAFAAGEPSPLPPLPLRYADFAEWQRRWLAEGAFEAQLSYWRTKLADAAPLLELPTDRPRPATRTDRGDRMSLWLSVELLEQLRALSRSQSSTLFMTLLAAVNVLLHRYAAQEDVLVGTPIAGRNRTEVEGLVGYFTNTLVLRTDCSGDPTFRELLSRAREVAIEAFANQDAPLERLIQELQPERSPAHSPLFQVMFALQNMRGNRADSSLPPDTLVLPGLDVSVVIPALPGTSKFDLAFGAGEHPQGLHVSIEYNTDLFDRATIERMSAHLGTLLEGIVSDPDQRISELPLLTDAERAKLVTEWNATSAERSQALLHGIFETQAARTPDAAAAVVEGEVLSYRELDARANRLAHRLRDLGVRSGDRVGVCLPRSLHLASATLGVLKAGAACVPLDPNYPAERLALMLRDAAVSVVVVDESTAGTLLEHPTPVLDLSQGTDAAASALDTALSDPVEPDATAYVIYTSGSTGTPRGVELTHRGLANHALASAGVYGLGPSDRVLQFSSISFDISIEELFTAWASGAAVVFRTDEMPLGGHDFLDWLSERSVSVLDLPTAYWHEWVNDLTAGGRRVPDGIRTVIVGGEKALASVYELWLGVGGDRVRWFNTYGPTEASVVVSAWEGDATRSEAVPGQLPIGRPLENVRAFVLDGKMQPAPIGVPGELYVGGLGVARGYLGQPELTAEKFVADPFSEEASARLYRTGDLVRYRPDGLLEFVGRTDDQVKIRGYRIEPGEIERALERHERVRTALVVVRESSSGAKNLVGFVEAEGDSAPSSRELREFLTTTLPMHLVPAAVVVLDAFPLTPNGKVDRNALPAPDQALELAAEVVEPRDDIEAAVIAVVGRLLDVDVDQISVFDDFFALGGHSLLAVRLAAEIERELGVPLPLNELFHGATMEQIAVFVRREEASSDAWSPLVPLRAEGERRPLFLFHTLQGDLMTYRGLVRHLAPDRPVYGLQPVGLDGRRNLRRSVEEMASDYVREIQTVQPHGPYLLCGYCFAGVAAYEVARQLEEQDEETALLAVIDASPIARQTRLDLERQKFADFLSRDLAGKAEWIARRWRGLKLKTTRSVRWTLHDLFVRLTRLPAPRRLQSTREAIGRARSRYVTSVSSCRLTLLRAHTSDEDDVFPAAWARLARGGLDLRVVRNEGIRHDNIMGEPHVQVVASLLEDAIGTALDGEDRRANTKTG
jgi:amino acid adenylation domain-containing protein